MERLTLDEPVPERMELVHGTGKAVDVVRHELRQGSLAMTAVV